MSRIRLLPEIVASQVCGEFEVDLETAYRDVEQFVKGLSAEGVERLLAQRGRRMDAALPARR